MSTDIRETLAEQVRTAAQPLTGAASDDDALLDLIGGARFVLIGEASHGTHEFYQKRAAITKRLIAERGFTAVAIEGDWPDAYEVNCYARRQRRSRRGRGARGLQALPDLDVAEIPSCASSSPGCAPIAERGPREAQAGFYSLYRSMEAVLGYLDKVDPEAAHRARERYRCFEDFRQDSQAYGHTTGLGGAELCEDDVVRQLVELRCHAADYARRDGRIAEDE
jgi:erythromycin esterase-like protein